MGRVSIHALAYSRKSLNAENALILYSSLRAILLIDKEGFMHALVLIAMICMLMIVAPAAAQDPGYVG